MNWIILIIAGLCEAAFTYCLGRAKGVSGNEWWTWIACFAAFYVLSAILLAKATQTLPLGTAYPVWTGIGAVGAVRYRHLHLQEASHLLAAVLPHNPHCVNHRTKSNIVSIVQYKKIQVENCKVFYREAGDTSKPTILLLHGFPSSSHMFRELMPELMDDFHLVAPDFPSFGQTESPSREDFEYSFDHLAKIVDKFTEAIIRRLQD